MYIADLTDTRTRTKKNQTNLLNNLSSQHLKDFADQKSRQNIQYKKKQKKTHEEEKKPNLHTYPSTILSHKIKILKIT